MALRVDKQQKFFLCVCDLTPLTRARALIERRAAGGGGATKTASRRAARRARARVKELSLNAMLE